VEEEEDMSGVSFERTHDQCGCTHYNKVSDESATQSIALYNGPYHARHDCHCVDRP
jgi:hypothetical protein